MSVLYLRRTHALFVSFSSSLFLMPPPFSALSIFLILSSSSASFFFSCCRCSLLPPPSSSSVLLSGLSDCVSGGVLSSEEDRTPRPQGTHTDTLFIHCPLSLLCCRRCRMVSEDLMVFNPISEINVGESSTVINYLKKTVCIWTFFIMYYSF